MSLSILSTKDLTVLTNTIQTYVSCFVSPYVSFENSTPYLKELNIHLTDYIELIEEDYIFCKENTHVLPKLDLPASFELFLFFACIKHNPLAKDTYCLLEKFNKLPIFQVKDFSCNSNPYYEIMHDILISSNDLLVGTINHEEFITILDKQKTLLFPDALSLYSCRENENFTEKELSEHQQFYDFQFLNDDSIIYLKEKIYLNLLCHFMDKPEDYKESPYLFMDFLGTYSFNREDSYSFTHLKEVFWRFEDKHWNVLKTLKNHPLYNLFLDALFVDNDIHVLSPDDNKEEYIYYFDFKSFTLFLKKNVVLDDLFLCSATENKNMQSFLSSIVQQNNYSPDNQRFYNLMILYEKNKIENKLKPKNLVSPVKKI